MINEGRIASGILKETIKEFHGLTIQLTISNSAYYDSEEHDAVSDTKSDLLVATHTSDGNERKITDTDTTKINPPHKLILNRLIPNIIPGAICPIDQTITEDVMGNWTGFGYALDGFIEGDCHGHSAQWCAYFLHS